MQVVTIGPKYQIVIPKEARKKFKEIRPGNKIFIKTGKKTITVKPIAENWSDLNYGKYKKYLKGAVEEVEKMRDEWEEKLREVEGGKS